MGMILSFCFLVGFRNQTVHLGGLFSDINGESLPNEPSNTWPKEKNITSQSQSPNKNSLLMLER